jgi:hypothetical protein
LNKETQLRAENQKYKIIAALREAGASGLTNAQLSKIALRYNARIQEMYVLGFGISTVPMSGGLTRYVLNSEPKSIHSKPDHALNILIKEIDKCGGNVDKEQLLGLLEANNFTVRRKVGSFS